MEAYTRYNMQLADWERWLRLTLYKPGSIIVAFMLALSHVDHADALMQWWHDMYSLVMATRALANLSHKGDKFAKREQDRRCYRYLQNVKACGIDCYLWFLKKHPIVPLSTMLTSKSKTTLRRAEYTTMMLTQHKRKPSSRLIFKELSKVVQQLANDFSNIDI